MSSRPVAPGPAGQLAQDTPPGGRRSYALESMSQWLGGQERLQIIDFGGINQQNVDYVTGMGHRLYSEDLLHSFDQFFGSLTFDAQEFPADRVEAFLEQTLDFPDQSADGALIWDSLQFLPAPLGRAVLDRVHRVLAPDALVLALFHSESSGPVASPQRCRVLDRRHVMLTPRPVRRPMVAFSTRAIERFFQRFQTLKFFLTRDNLQEVIARR